MQPHTTSDIVSCPWHPSRIYNLIHLEWSNCIEVDQPDTTLPVCTSTYLTITYNTINICRMMWYLYTVLFIMMQGHDTQAVKSKKTQRERECVYSSCIVYTHIYHLLYSYLCMYTLEYWTVCARGEQIQTQNEYTPTQSHFAKAWNQDIDEVLLLQ